MGSEQQRGEKNRGSEELRARGLLPHSALPLGRSPDAVRACF